MGGLLVLPVLKRPDRGGSMKITYITRDYWDAYRWIKARLGTYGIKTMYHIHYVMKFD